MADIELSHTLGQVRLLALLKMMLNQQLLTDGERNVDTWNDPYLAMAETSSHMIVGARLLPGFY
jgi:hypothetical protein